MTLNVVYSTSRANPCLEWFFQSLERETGGDYSGIRIIVVDGFANPHPSLGITHEERKAYVGPLLRGPDTHWVAPKPCPWQGKYRQTKEDWFAVANSRNTGLCFCLDGWVAFCDDLSLLMPGWLGQAFAAMRHPKHITAGAYRKVKEMRVEEGVLVSFSPHLGSEGQDMGIDSRLKHTKGVPLDCDPGWLFGYSVGPVEAYLSVNGYDERCHGLGFEDVPTGINLSRKGWKMRYNPNMMAYESEEHHYFGIPMKKSDYGVSPNDKSHAMKAVAETGDGFAPLSPLRDGTRTLSEIRERVKAGAPFPYPAENIREWYTGKLLSEL